MVFIQSTMRWRSAAAAVLVVAMPVLVEPAGIPVVFVSYGELPLYLKLNMELAARYNDVVVISDVEGIERFNWASNGIDPLSSSSSSSSSGSATRITFEPLAPFLDSAQRFAPLYHHMSRDQREQRVKHELRCIQRWFVLQDYMQRRNVSRAFFGDGDSTVFTSVTDVVTRTRGDCATVINIEAQFHPLHWVGAGEASVWTLPAIRDFCRFTSDTYRNHVATLQVKGRAGSSVVDMSLLWLWWVAHHRHLPAGWATGRPFALDTTETPLPADLAAHRAKSDAAFEYAKTLEVPRPAATLRLCNGMDAVDRYAFDHYHGWKSGTNFSLGLDDGSGVPSAVAASQYCGGRPEAVEPPSEVARLAATRLRLVNVHYQGGQKTHLPYDVCRVLLRTGTKAIVNAHLRAKCAEEIQRHVVAAAAAAVATAGNNATAGTELQALPCQVHEERTPGIKICF